MYATSARHRVYAIRASTGKLILVIRTRLTEGRGRGMQRCHVLGGRKIKGTLTIRQGSPFAHNAETGKLISEFASGRQSKHECRASGVTLKPISAHPHVPGLFTRICWSWEPKFQNCMRHNPAISGYKHKNASWNGPSIPFPHPENRLWNLA